ncbi:MAG: TIGR00153 family protein [Endozoicomonadaceae bacterium]|nr:TIGR00153 family protein [Endozoicomonadaceae bacterium]
MTTPNILSNVFGRSPVNSIQMHMLKVHECANQLPVFFEVVFDENWVVVYQIQSHIKQLENEADDLKRCVRLSLPKSLFLPVPRSDILRLIAMQDEIANCSKDIAGLIMGRKIQFPETLQQPLKNYLLRSIDSSHQAVLIVNQLDALIKSGFKGPQRSIVEEMIHTLGHLESEIDQMQIEVRYVLFQLEETLLPVNIMFLYKIIESIGHLSDDANHIGGCLELML